MEGPGEVLQETEELTNFNTENIELVEVFDKNKNDVVTLVKDADIILLGSGS